MSRVPNSFPLTSTQSLAKQPLKLTKADVVSALIGYASRFAKFEVLIDANCDCIIDRSPTRTAGLAPCDHAKQFANAIAKHLEQSRKDHAPWALVEISVKWSFVSTLRSHAKQGDVGCTYSRARDRGLQTERTAEEVLWSTFVTKKETAAATAAAAEREKRELMSRRPSSRFGGTFGGYF